MISQTQQTSDEPGSRRLISKVRAPESLLVAYATAIGLLPTCVFLQTPLFLVAVTVLALAWAGWRFRHPSARAVKELPSAEWQQASAIEYLLAGTGGAFITGVAGFMSLAFYGVIYGGTALLAWMGVISTAGFHSIALYPTLVATFLFGWACVDIMIDELSRVIYPEIAGTRSAMYRLTVEGRGWTVLRVVGVAGPALILLGLRALGLSDGWIPVVTQLVVTYAALPTWNVTERARSRPIPAELIEAIARLFRAASYHVLLDPSSKNTDDLGPLLSAVDLIADGGDCAFVVRVKYAGAPTDRSGNVSADEQLALARRERAEMANLQTTAWTLSTSQDRRGFRFKDRLGIKSDDFQPLLVYAGIEPDDGLRSFADKASIPLIEIDERELALLKRNDDSTELEALVNRFVDDTLKQRRRGSAEESSL